MSSNKNFWLIIISFLSVFLFWGSTYLFNKIGVQVVPPFMWAGIRFTIAGVLLLIIASFSKNKKLQFMDIKNSVIAGILLIVLGNGLLVWALKFIDSGFAAMLFASQPLVVLLLMKALYGTPITTKSWIGIILGVLGMYLLVNRNSLAIPPQGLLLSSLALLSWSYGMIFVSRNKTENSSHAFYWISGIQMFSAGIFNLLISFFIENTTINTNYLDNKLLFSMTYLVIFGSIIAYLAFNYLLKHVSPNKVSTTALVNPIVAVLLGALFLGEKLTNQSIIASTILLLGVYFIQSDKTSHKFKKKLKTQPKKIIQ